MTKPHESEDEGFSPREAEQIKDLLSQPEMQRLAVECLEEGAEVLRLHKGWSRQELAQHLGLPPDWTEEYVNVEMKLHHFGSRIIELREIARLTPGELASQAEVPIQVLRAIEEGHGQADPSLDELRALAEQLETNLPFLFFWAERLARDGF